MRVAELESIMAIRMALGLHGTLVIEIALISLMMSKSKKGVMLLEHISYHNEAHVLSLLDVIRISGFRPVSDAIDTREQCGN
jgi:hypothetical protein